jgi:hypothetical protein
VWPRWLRSARRSRRCARRHDLPHALPRLPAERSTAADHAQHGREAGCTASGAPCRRQLTAGPSTAPAPHIARTAVDVAQSKGRSGDAGGYRDPGRRGAPHRHHPPDVMAGCRLAAVRTCAATTVRSSTGTSSHPHPRCAGWSPAAWLSGGRRPRRATRPGSRQRGEVVGAQVGPDADEVGGVAPAVMFDRGVDGELDHDPRLDGCVPGGRAGASLAGGRQRVRPRMARPGVRGAAARRPHRVLPVSARWCARPGGRGHGPLTGRSINVSSRRTRGVGPHSPPSRTRPWRACQAHREGLHDD